MFWDKVAWVYDVFANVINRKANKALCAAVAELIRPTDEVLECACGTGLLTGVMAPRCRALTATDFSKEMLKRAERKYGKYPNIKFEQADITRLGYPDASFDAVVAANVIHLLDAPYAALRELDSMQAGRPADHPHLYEPDRKGHDQQRVRRDRQGGRELQARVHAGYI